jgi:hypothetical protein
MDAAVSAGDAVPLTLGGGWLTGYQGAWWVLSEIGWLRVTDEATVADIDHVAARLTEVAEDTGGVESAYGVDLQNPDEDAEKLRRLGSGEGMRPDVPATGVGASGISDGARQRQCCLYERARS